MAEAPAAGFDIRRMLLLGGVVVVIVFAGIFFFVRGCLPATQGSDGSTIIYSNLDLKDAANVVARLKELNVPYELRDQGRAIAVPKNKADEARIGLAEENLPAGGVVGWEIFDEARLGATDFDRRIQLIRAISGELSRTIGRIEAIEDARVQIVIPETRLFAAEAAPVTASVMLRLRPGAELSLGKINGIVHLVASSVENLIIENVTVIDDTGRILSAKGLEVTELIAPAEAETIVEEEIEPAPETVEVTEEVATAVATQPAMSMEERILLKVRAKKELEADLSGKAQEIVNRFYPLNSVIVKVNVDTEEYEEDPYADDLKIKRLITAVLVDNRVDLSAQLKNSTYKSVAAAIGYNRKRGDRIVLQLVPFHLATPPPEVVKVEIEETPLPEKKPAMINYVSLGFLLLGIVAVIALVVFVRRMFKRKPEVAPVGKSVIRQTVSPEKMSSLENIKSMTERNPERIAELLKNWLTE